MQYIFIQITDKQRAVCLTVQKFCCWKCTSVLCCLLLMLPVPKLAVTVTHHSYILHVGEMFGGVCTNFFIP